MRQHLILIFSVDQERKLRELQQLTRESRDAWNNINIPLLHALHQVQHTDAAALQLALTSVTAVDYYYFHLHPSASDDMVRSVKCG